MVFTELEFDNIFKIFSFCTSRTHNKRIHMFEDVQLIGLDPPRFTVCKLFALVVLRSTQPSIPPG